MNEKGVFNEEEEKGEKKELQKDQSCDGPDPVIR
jgi:hypothetical protein